MKVDDSLSLQTNMKKDSYWHYLIGSSSTLVSVVPFAAVNLNNANK
jgi:hypothetical protein